MRSCVILLTKLNTPCTEGYRSGHNGADSKSLASCGTLDLVKP